MPTPCRRSARIASTSKRSIDSPAPQRLTSVAETNESPAHASPRVVNAVVSSPKPAPATPSTTAPHKLAMSEMHPSKVHQTMAPPSSGLRNGFTDIDYSKTPMQALIQTTPSKTPASSSEFTFRCAPRGADQHLGPAAREIMESLRGEAAKIKAQLAQERARKLAEQSASGEDRKIATAKGVSGRYSAAHMAQFQKMDSIEGHASSFRAAPGRSTPVKPTTPVKLITPIKRGIKRSSSKANLDGPNSARPKTVPPRLLVRSVEKHGAAHHLSKRIRPSVQDDVSQGPSSIPRPKSSGNDSLRSDITRSQTLGSLMTPTKSSLARTLSVKTPTTAPDRSPSQPNLNKVNSFSAKVGTSLLRSPSKVDLGLLARSPGRKGFGGLSWGTTNNSKSERSNIPTQVETPGRFGRIKSILKLHPSGKKPQSAIPQLSASIEKTPTQTSLTEGMFPKVPLTTPGRKQDRHVNFTPETERAAMAQESPSPVKSNILQIIKLPAPKFVAGKKAVVSQESTTGDVTYPDLSAYNVDGDTAVAPPESVPGTFTFRSDHTISFDSNLPEGFGAAAGQASVRPVRKSTGASLHVPGSFPGALEASPNKENQDPLTRKGIPHGMSNKKRHRAGSDDEEEDEGSKRSPKKLRKNPPVAEGHALVAPKLIARVSPTKRAVGSSSQTPSPQKKRTGMTLRRLQMLAQPKIRK